MARARTFGTTASLGVTVALAALLTFGYLRYDHFLSLYNVTSVLRYNAMFALVSLGMCFVVMSGGIDLSVGAVAALGSVAAALASPHGLLAGLAAGVGAGLLMGAVSGLLVTRARLLPFIATLATMLAAGGAALLLADNQSVAVSYTSGFTALGQGDLGVLPIPCLIAAVAYLIGSGVLNLTAAGRTVLAVGGQEEASRLMGLQADRVKFSVYLGSGGLAAGVGAGLLMGAVSGLLVTRARLLPFIATLATMLAAGGAALLLADNQSVAVSYTSGFTTLGQGDLGVLPIPCLIAAAAYLIGSGVLNLTAAGRTVLAVGGQEEASRLMGLQADRIKFAVYLGSGGLAGLAGVILASQFGAGQPIEGVGWELSAIASVVVGGTLLSGGSGSVMSTLAGVLLLGVLFNVLNFENGLGWISLSAYWQSVIRGLFLLVVVAIQSTHVRSRGQAGLQS